MHFADALMVRIQRKQTPLVVGIDPRRDRLPAALRETLTAAANTQEGRRQTAWAYERFGCEIIDAVHHLVPAIKPQMAFFEQLGPAGMTALANLIQHANASDLLVILDGKRNDIGSTAEAYAEAYLGRGLASPWGADALTVNPWLGLDSLQPFVQRCREVDAGLFVLVHTSNSGSQDFQELPSDRGSIYQRVAEKVEALAASTVGVGGFGSVGAVVGATYPEQLAELRASMPHTLFLIPGFGAQGGSAADVAAGLNANGLGAVINSSRAIIFAYESPSLQKKFAGSHWQRCVEEATRLSIAQLATETSAGKLRQIG